MNQLRESGFTLIEILMVILLVAILAGIAIPQFIDFQTEARNAATQASVGALRTAISNQKAQMIIRCAASPSSWPPAANINANNITNANTPCTAAQVPASQVAFMASGIPSNPWGAVGTATTVTDCTGGDCTQGNGNGCDGNAYDATHGGWCYNPASGAIWANSANNGGAAGATENNY